jgi:hypothetical protein
MDWTDQFRVQSPAAAVFVSADGGAPVAVPAQRPPAGAPAEGGGAPTIIDIQVRQRDKYACTACGRRVSWRALRITFYLLLFAGFIFNVIATAVQEQIPVWTAFWQCLKAIIYSFFPLPSLKP